MSDIPDDLSGLSEALARSSRQQLPSSVQDSIPLAEVFDPRRPAPISVDRNATLDALVVDQPIHQGSPFATPTDVEELHLARGAAFASLAIGLWGIATFWISFATIFNGVLGLVLGAWGIRSRQRRSAIVGLATSLVTLVVTLAWWTYQQSGR